MTTAPRLVTRVLAMSFTTAAIVLAAVFVLVSLDARARVRREVADKVDRSQRLFTQVEEQRQHDLFAMASTLAENPTLKAALDTFQAEARYGDRVRRHALVATVQHELDKLARRVPADVLAVTGADGRVLVASGPRADAWAAGMPTGGVVQGVEPGGEWLARTSGDAYRVLTVPIALDDALIGSLEVGVALDREYARSLAALGNAECAVVVDGRLQASTLEGADAEALARGADRLHPNITMVTLGADTWMVRRLSSIGTAELYTLASLDREAAAATRQALSGLAAIAAVSVALAGLGSFVLARTLARPIDELSAALGTMTEEGRIDRPLVPTGTSREVDALVEAFNRMLTALSRAEAETEASYLGAIRALAAALDARDPYTSGHSERVSLLAVEMGRVMRLPDADLEVLRLGALLHDIGKIGVPDHVLRKPGALTPDEFQAIKMHPTVGARIVRSIPLLAAHVPIVELHHERPDGRGYPFGLRGDEIPLLARIAHVADAYDAMTSARAYRPAMLPQDAVAELCRHQGTDFDASAVQALVAALPRLASPGAPPAANVLPWSSSHRTAIAS